MKLDDIVFAIGIILISSLLVYVIYDDITNPYPMPLDKNMEDNINKTINITEKDTELVPNADVTTRINTKYTYNADITGTQGSKNVISASKTNVRTDSVQNANSPTKNIVNNNNNNRNDMKIYDGNTKPSGFSNNQNNRAIRQNQPARQ